MVSAFRMGPAASRSGLCDMDSVLFRVTQSRVKKLGSPGTKNKPIRIQIERTKSSVYFRPSRICHLTRD